MAIEIIKQGKLPETFYTGECSFCGCIVECKREDHKAGWTPSRHKNSVIQVDCPTENCNYTIRCRVKKSNAT